MMEKLTKIDRVPEPPMRPGEAHKGTFGTVIIVGGSAAMIGAPALCARAALRGGAGLVKIATTTDVLPHALTIEPSATGVALAGDDNGWRQAIDAADPESKAVLAVGPGMGLSEGGGQKVLALLRGSRKIVLDADGLNLLARTARPRPLGNAEIILTPHPGEFERLAKPLGITESPTDANTRRAAAAKLARAHHGVVLLKGRHTVVTDGERVYINQTGNPALATAGSGDVLTGLIAALCAQGTPAFDAAVLGAYLHGLAADRWAQRHGRSGLRAQDLADELPDAFEQRRTAT
jgi:NAD(P)H-hydrate epimerase